MFNCPLDNLQTETKGTVLLKDAQELKDFTKSEENMLKNAVQAKVEDDFLDSNFHQFWSFMYIY